MGGSASLDCTLDWWEGWPTPPLTPRTTPQPQQGIGRGQGAAGGHGGGRGGPEAVCGWDLWPGSGAGLYPLAGRADGRDLLGGEGTERLGNEVRV